MWFLFALFTTLSWGIADLFYKKGADPEDRYSYLKIVIMVGLVMGIHGVCYMLINGVSFDPFDMIRYLPVSTMYILSMALGYVGLKYIELSVSSPVQNSSGAVTALLCILFLRKVPTVLEGAGIVIITAGLILLSIFEKKQESIPITEDKLKYRQGLAALMFPLFYCAIDGIGTFADAIYLNEEAPLISEDGALLAYEFTFFLCAVVVFLFLTVIRKEKITPKKQGTRLLAAVFETAGQVFYVNVIGANAVVAAPMIASYCVVSIILSRIFLKEKLLWKQYAVIILVLIGIAVLALSEGLNGDF